jgi:hypothetical protein
MNIGKARALFEQVASGEYHGSTVGEYLEAVKIVLDMETHNSISKKMIISVCKWLVEIAEKAVSPYRWIPVSERLPESGTYCLFTVFEHDFELEATTIETVYGRFDDYGEQRYWSWEDEVGNCCIEGEEQLDGYHDEIIEKVLAWMPLPEPYKPNNK